MAWRCRFLTARRSQHGRVIGHPTHWLISTQVKAYTETHGVPPPSKKALKQSQPKKKRAPSAYVLFVSDVLKHETAPKQVDRMRAVAAKWGSMSDAEKAPYQRRAAEAKAAM